MPRDAATAATRRAGDQDADDTALLTGQTTEHPQSAANSNRRGLQGILALAGIPLLVLCLVPLSALLHPLSSSSTAAEKSKDFTLSKGHDVYREAHPDALRAAEAAELGPWANIDTQGMHPGEKYVAKGEIKSNGTHDYEKTALFISLDGVRADYLTRNMTPHLLSLSEKGLRAEYMESCFPSLTFPNHWSIMTGLYPASHGIVANDFFDPESGEEFVYTEPQQSWSSHWWGGEPMWSTAVKSGLKSAVLMWPGPPKMKDGTKPTYWKPFANKIQWDLKTDQIMKWLDMDISKRPNLINAYLPEVDQQGHHAGPDSDEVTEYLKYVDDFIASIYAELEKRHLTDIVNVVVTSDHGMTSTHNERVVYLDEILGQDGWDAIEHKEGWPSCGLRFKEGTDDDEMLRRLQEASDQSNGGFKVFTEDTMPNQWHFGDNARIAPIYIVPEVGWAISNKEEHQDTMKGDYHPYGNHGYDPIHPDMHAIFVAHGPFAEDIKASRGRRQEAAQAITMIPAFKNIEIYGLAMRLLDIPQDNWAPTNGTGDVWDQHVLWK